MKIEIRDITKNFGDKEVLKGITFETESGKAHGLLGRNGAGKTTTIRIIMGVFFQNSGEILVDEKERGLYPKIKIAEQLVYFGMLRGLSKQDARKAGVKWLDRMGMTEYKDKKLETLSKGNQQKIQLAATLLCDPQLIILDEPFSGLDPVNAMLLKDVISEMIDGGSAVIFSSHQMNYIEEFCRDISILNAGKIAVDGQINDIKRSYPRNTLIIYSQEYDRLSSFIAKSFSERTDSVESSEKDSIVTVKLRNEKDKDELIKLLLDNKFAFDGFRVKEPSLNDIFVQYTEGGI